MHPLPSAHPATPVALPAPRRVALLLVPAPAEAPQTQSDGRLNSPVGPNGPQSVGNLPGRKIDEESRPSAMPACPLDVWTSGSGPLGRRARVLGVRAGLFLLAACCLGGADPTSCPISISYSVSLQPEDGLGSGSPASFASSQPPYFFARVGVYSSNVSSS